jgi:hypothetical protein
MTKILFHCSNTEQIQLAALKRNAMSIAHPSSKLLRRGIAIRTGWQRLVKFARGRYRPELHYMRGPGPKWYAKHRAGSAGG